MMQVILLKDINKLGKKGQVKNVSDGYALNFLIPQKLVERATGEKIEQIEAATKKVAEQVVKEKGKYDKLINKLKSVKLEMKGKVSDGGKLFAGLAAGDIVKALKDQEKIELEEKFIKLDKKIKDIGEHQVEIDLGNNLKTNLIINIKDNGD